MYVCMYVCMCVCVCVCVCEYMCIHTHTYTHTHTMFNKIVLTIRGKLYYKTSAMSLQHLYSIAVLCASTNSLKVYKRFSALYSGFSTKRVEIHFLTSTVSTGNNTVSAASCCTQATGWMDWTQVITERHEVDTMFCENWSTISKIETDMHSCTHKIHGAVKRSLLQFSNKSRLKNESWYRE